MAKEQGLADKASFQVADALQQPFEDNSFDLIWSMESGEHMPDKARFVGELARVCMPGGRIIIVTWCHRSVCLSSVAAADILCLQRRQAVAQSISYYRVDPVPSAIQPAGMPLELAHWTAVCMCRNLEAGETELTGNEKFLLDLICKAYYLPKWCSINDYRAIFSAEGLQVWKIPESSVLTP